MSRNLVYQSRDGSVLDSATGEVIDDGYIAVHIRRRQNGFGRRWAAMGQDGMLLLADRRREIGIDGFGLFALLVGVLDFENMIQISPSEIGRRLGMKSSNVSRAMKRLVAVEAILEGPVVCGRRSYRLNPAFGWKGSAKGHRDALKDRMKAAHIRVVA